MLSLCQSKKGRIPQPFPLTLTLSGTPKHASPAAKDGSAVDPAPHAHTHGSQNHLPPCGTGTPSGRRGTCW